MPRIGRDGRHERFARTVEGIAALAAFCRQHGVELVVMEATGGYEKLLPFALLWETGLPCAPSSMHGQMRDFAKAMGRLEKTDRLDAGIIAWYAEIKGIVAQAPASPAQQQLQALVTRLRQLTATHTAQKNQRRLVGEPAAVLRLVRRTHRRAQAADAPDRAGDRRPARRRSAVAGPRPGLPRDQGRRRPQRRLVKADGKHEIGTISNKAIAKLVGVAPIANDTGKRKGRRPVRGGRAAHHLCSSPSPRSSGATSPTSPNSTKS